MIKVTCLQAGSKSVFLKWKHIYSKSHFHHHIMTDMHGSVDRLPHAEACVCPRSLALSYISLEMDQIYTFTNGIIKPAILYALYL